METDSIIVGPHSVAHELDEHQRHRIVAIFAEGTTTASGWYHVSEIAHLGQYFACASAEHPLPIGIWKVREVPFHTIT